MAEEQVKKRGPGRPRKHPPKDPDAPKRGPGRPSKAEMQRRAAEAGFEKLTSIDLIHIGVTKTWLARAFHLDKNTISRKLVDCQPIRKEGSTYYYAIHQAAQYLVRPKGNIEQYIRQLRPNELPPQLQDQYWAAMLKRQQWETRAKVLWPAEDVLDVLGELAMAIKSRVRLLPDELERIAGMTPEMRNKVEEETDELLNEIYKLMVEAPKNRTTLPMSERIDLGEVGEPATEFDGDGGDFDSSDADADTDYSDPQSYV